MQRKQAGLVSTVPTHIVQATWERFQGIYHLLLLIATRASSAGADPNGSRRFAIGQYLLFSRGAYQTIGGHKAVAHRLSEDLALGAAVGDAGLRATVLVRHGALRVRMYPEGLQSFIAGWRRSFRDGIGTTGFIGSVEMFVVVTWLLGVAVWACEALILQHPAQAITWTAIYGATAALVAIKQREVGDFSATSALAYPIFVLLFIWVSVLVLFDAVRQKPVVWRGREINLDGQRS